MQIFFKTVVAVVHAWAIRNWSTIPEADDNREVVLRHLKISCTVYLKAMKSGITFGCKTSKKIVSDCELAF